MRLLKPRRAFTAWMVSATTVMDESIKSLFGVKYPTKPARAALLNLPFHEKLGCLKASARRC
jgi:hypothetical protein